jgi:hypothetical protein
VDLDQRIVVLSSNRETLDAVQEYFRRMGARPSGVSLLDDALPAAREADALFFFADDFPPADALRTVSSLAVERLVVITQEVELYEAEQRQHRSQRELIVLRRPAWGWMLLDALRAKDQA